ncbi:chemotaxis protein [Nocardioides phosphati]|uniref:Chemotaxis protein n=1 Tax=Nocardioides phosphati TaxID=1867775 RepID=A0ABQ2NEZ8_9ACTN|nr:DUF4012 domain-containing protein [Nocardioides phosphati]GGO92476.1 chemotaxis protein [Nocardioides phosphati]
MTITRRRLTAAALAAAVVAFAYAAWVALGVRSDLLDGEAAARDLRAALEDPGTSDAAEKAADRFEAHLASADRRTSGWTWAVLEGVPFVGDDARAVATLSRVGAAAARDGVRPLLEAGVTDPEGFAPRDGQVDLDRIAMLRKPMAAAAAAFGDASEELAEVDCSGLVGPLARSLRTLTDDIDAAADGLEAGRVATELLPTMLGGSGERRILLAFQSPAEPRAAGGFPGALAVLEARDGRLELAEQIPAGALPSGAQVLPLTAEEQERFGPAMAIYAGDAGFTPHFPRVTELWRAHWDRSGRPALDGAVAVDPVALGYLLAATGPVQVRGAELTADNVAHELLHGAYVRYADPLEQDRWFQQVASAVFSRLTTGSVDARALLDGLARGAREGRLLVNSRHPEEQQLLTGTQVAGEVPDASVPAPQAGVYFNDSTGSKMGWFFHPEVTVETTSCDASGRTMTGTLGVRSSLEAGKPLPAYVSPGSHGIPKGTHLVSVELFAPQEGTLDRITFDAEPQENAVVTPYRGHATTSVALELEPAGHHVVTWRMTTPSREPVSIRVTPGVDSGGGPVELPAC